MGSEIVIHPQVKVGDIFVASKPIFKDGVEVVWQRLLIDSGTRVCAQAVVKHEGNWVVLIALGEKVESENNKEEWKVMPVDILLQAYDRVQPRVPQQVSDLVFQINGIDYAYSIQYDQTVIKLMLEAPAGDPNALDTMGQQTAPRPPWMRPGASVYVSSTQGIPQNQELAEKTNAIADLERTVDTLVKANTEATARNAKLAKENEALKTELLQAKKSLNKFYKVNW